MHIPVPLEQHNREGPPKPKLFLEAIGFFLGSLGYNCANNFEDATKNK